MAKFKVGDRVRLKGPAIAEFAKPLVGKEAILIGKSRAFDDCWQIDLLPPSQFAEQVWTELNMEPITNPHQEAWEAFKTLHLVGKPELVTL